MTPEQIEEMEAALAGATDGEWFGANMTHVEGRPMTPEEIGEYVCNSVKMGTPDIFLFVGAEGADIAHFGNGQCGNANATLTVLSKQMAAHIIAQREQIAALEKRVKGGDGLAEAVRLQLEEGVQDRTNIFRDDGVHSKHDLCRHGLPQYNGCEACSDEHMSVALAAYRATGGQGND